VKVKPEIDMKRIFIAVKIDPGVVLQNMISAFRTGLTDEKIKWAESENFHVTMAFLGDTAEDKIKTIIKMLKSACEGFGEFEIVIKGAGLFKNSRDPRVIWTGIEPSEKLNNLHKTVKLGLKETGIVLEERTFNPHLTLGRIKSIRDNEVLKTLLGEYDNLELQKQEVKEVILYESLLFHSGPVYKPLGKFALGNK
jgi:2'-5' RNA ligase